MKKPDLFLKFFSWIDSIFEKINDLWIFNIGQELKKKKKK
jgi:hypothetical protein|tara:strand:- start:196 stop:315 length:120 start_codon:yes stop_codon:yes gene_type:complete